MSKSVDKHDNNINILYMLINSIIMIMRGI